MKMKILRDRDMKDAMRQPFLLRMLPMKLQMVYLTMDTLTTFSRRHSSGWTICGKLTEDWYVWVNDFRAVHDTLGVCWGNFEREVHATSEEAFNHFYENH